MDWLPSNASRENPAMQEKVIIAVTALKRPTIVPKPSPPDAMPMLPSRLISVGLNHISKTSCPKARPQTFMAIGLLMTVITLGGFILLISGATQLARAVGLGPEQVMTIIVLDLVMTLAIDILLIWQISRIIKHALNAGSSSPPKKLKTASQPPLQIPSPAQHPIPVSSVTENTTRTLRTPHKEPGF